MKIKVTGIQSAMDAADSIAKAMAEGMQRSFRHALRPAAFVCGHAHPRALYAFQLAPGERCSACGAGEEHDA